MIILKIQAGYTGNRVHTDDFDQIRHSHRSQNPREFIHHDIQVIRPTAWRCRPAEQLGQRETDVGGVKTSNRDTVSVFQSQGSSHQVCKTIACISF